MTAVLVDSNILVYTFDAADLTKHRLAVDVMRSLHEGPRPPALSVQCLTEFYNSVRRKIAAPLSHATAYLEVGRLVQTCMVFDLTTPAVLEACRATDAYQMSLRDALIWAVAKLNQVALIVTEDGQHDRVIEGVRYANPFDPRFDFAALGG